jgi:hypothetical protein
MAFDRSKYKSVSLKKVSDQVSEAESNSKTSFSGGSGRTKYHKIEEGDNWFKIAPAHDPENSPYVPISTANLECEGDKWEDGEIVGKEVRNRKVFIATVHSPKDKHGKFMMTKDPVETYLEYVHKKLNDEYPEKAEREKKMAPLRGFRGSDGKWVFGIQPDHKIATWSWDNKWEIGRLDLNKKWYKDMEKLSIRETADEPVPSDIFVDLDEGFPLILTKTVTQEGKRKKTEYKVDTDKPNIRKRESVDDFFERVAVPEKALEEWQEKKSLEEMLVGVYSEKDFNMAVDGLERFDKKWGFEIFENTEFLDEMEEISKMVENLPKKEEKKDGDSEESESKESKEETPEEETPSESKVTPVKMKRFIRTFIDENYDESDLPDGKTSEEIVKELKGSAIEEWYTIAKEGNELPFEKTESEEEESDEESPVEDSSPDDAVEADVASELAKLRARRKKK